MQILRLVIRIYNKKSKKKCFGSNYYNRFLCRGYRYQKRLTNIWQGESPKCPPPTLLHTSYAIHYGSLVLRYLETFSLS